MKKTTLISLVAAALLTTACGEKTPSELLTEEMTNQKITDKTKSIELINSIYTKIQDNIAAESCSNITDPKTNIDKTIYILTNELCSNRENIDNTFNDLIADIQSLKQSGVTLMDIKMLKWKEKGFDEISAKIYMSNHVPLEEAVKIFQSDIYPEFIKAFIENGIVTLDAMNSIIFEGVLRSINDVPLLAKAGIKTKSDMKAWAKFRLPTEVFYSMIDKGWTTPQMIEFFEIIKNEPVSYYQLWIQKDYSFDEIKGWISVGLKNPHADDIDILKSVNIMKPSEYKEWKDIGISITTIIAEFVKNKITVETMKEWVECGVTQYYILESFLSKGISSQEAKEWNKIGIINPSSMKEWKESKYNTPNQVLSLKEEGYDIVKNSPYLIIKWKEEGVKDDTQLWVDAGVGLRYINSWRQSGLTSEFAKTYALGNYSKPHEIKELLDLKIKPEAIKDMINKLGNLRDIKSFYELQPQLDYNEIIDIKQTNIKIPAYKYLVDNSMGRFKDIKEILPVTSGDYRNMALFIHVFNKDAAKYQAYVASAEKQTDKLKTVLYFIDEYNKYNKKMDLNEIEALFQISDNNYMTSLNLRPFIEFNRDLPTMKQWIQLYKKYNISGRDGFYTVARYDYSAEDMEYVFKNGVFSSEIQSGEAFNIMNEYAYYLSAADLMKKVKSGIKIDKNLEKDYQELKQKEIEKLNKMESAT